MKLLYDAGDQPGELVHINRIDKSHGFFYAVWERNARIDKSKVESTEISRLRSTQNTDIQF